MMIDEVQADVSDLIEDLKAILADLESAESCEVKADLCCNLRSARTHTSLLKDSLDKMVKRAERCPCGRTANQGD